MMIDSQTAPSHDISEVPASGASVPPIIALQVATSSTNTGVNGSEASTHGDPGSTWNGKKFREEYDKAFNDLLDQTWTMGECYLYEVVLVGR